MTLMALGVSISATNRVTASSSGSSDELAVIPRTRGTGRESAATAT
jgi:hypothetical protein